MISVYPSDESQIQKAEKISAFLDGELSVSEPEGLYIKVSPDGVSLEGDGLSYKGDFSRLIPRLKKENLYGEMLIKAAKKPETDNMTVVDATAGLGEDSFLLAAVGYNVTMFEYDPIIAVLLEDALERGAKAPETCAIISRMSLKKCDSVEGMRKLDFTPDIILLDPMFPKRQKSGLIKKKFQLLQKIEKPCGNEDALLSSALECHPKKIIVKRPQKGPYLSGKKPSYTIEGNSIRYDCIVL